MIKNKILNFFTNFSDMIQKFVKKLKKDKKFAAIVAGGFVMFLTILILLVLLLLPEKEAPEEIPEELQVGEVIEDGKVRAKAVDSEGKEVEVVIGSTENEGDEFFLDPIVIDIGEVMIPVRTPTSISYVIAQVGLGMKDPRKADFLRNDIIADRVRNEVIEIMLKMAEYNLFSGEKVDTDYASYALQKKLSEKYEFITEVLFLKFIKQNIGG